MKHLTIDIPLYGTGVHVYIGPKKDMAKVCKKRGIVSPEGASGMTWLREGKHPIIWCESKKNGVVVHESIHACMHILNIRGIKTETDNDEPLAYLVEYLVGRIMKMK